MVPLSRSLVGFLLFCLLLALVSAGVVWYVGPTLAGIVVDDTRRENPYYLLQLLSVRAAEPDLGAPSYRTRFATLAGDDGGRVLWQGGRVKVVEGSVLLDVAGIQLVEFATGADLVQMLTSSAYRSLEADFGDASTRHLGSPNPPEALVPAAATVAVLYHVDADAGEAALGVAGERGWLGLLPKYHGDVLWDTPVAAVRSRREWNRALLLQFPDMATAEAWLADPITATERAIARKQVDDMVVLLVQPSMFVPRRNSRTTPNSSNSPRFGNVSAAISSTSR